MKTAQVNRTTLENVSKIQVVEPIKETEQQGKRGNGKEKAKKPKKGWGAGSVGM